VPASLFDTSVWVALAFGNHPHHPQAKTAFELADNLTPAVFCRATQQSFLRQLSSPIVSKVWNFCNTLRDDGVGYGDYLEQLTYLLFLKMADEYSKPPYNRVTHIPAATIGAACGPSAAPSWRRTT
jgi:predicted nucleic acid-binding protein